MAKMSRSLYKMLPFVHARKKDPPSGAVFPGPTGEFGGETENWIISYK